MNTNYVRKKDFTMIFTSTPLDGVMLIDLEPKKDERGFFSRYYCENTFAQQGLNTRWVQVNDSLSIQKATLRGLHFQTEPYAEVKLIRCVQGCIWDVVVDIRPTSPTFRKYFGAQLSDQNRTMMYVPEGFAHGFVTLQENCEIIYMVSEFYNPQAENTLLWCDIEIDISWPVKPAVISEKDQHGKTLAELFDI